MREEKTRKLQEKKLRAKASELGKRVSRIKRNRVAEAKVKTVPVSCQSALFLAGVLTMLPGLEAPYGQSDCGRTRSEGESR